MKKFQELELDPRIKEGLSDAGFVNPFPIQERAIEPLLQKKNVIGQAKTGTGKTAAYAIPMLQTIDVKSRNVQGFVLAPTRELAVQIAQEIRRLGRHTGVKVLAIYGGQSINIQLEALAHYVHIVVGTPGRVIDLIERRRLALDSAKFVVIDEADVMLDMGFIEDVEYILRFLPEYRQISLFSATMPERIVRLADRYMKNAERILIDSDEPSVETLDQYYTRTEESDKLATLLEILEKEKPSSAIIFCATKYRTSKVSKLLERRFLDAAPLNGDMSQHQRDHVMNLFRSHGLDLLVATDLAGRGIDIQHVSCVINYDIPKYPLLYFHRVGRTARAGDKGKAFTLVSDEEVGDFVKIKNMTNAEIKPLYPRDELFVAQAFHSYHGRNSYSYNSNRNSQRYRSYRNRRPTWRNY